MRSVKLPCLKGIGKPMIQLLVRWIISAILLLVVSRLVPGFEVDGLRSALIAALVIGLVNATLGLFLKIVTFPLTLVSLRDCSCWSSMP